MDERLTRRMSPQSLAASVLEDDESLLWAGQPDVDAMVLGTRRVPGAMLWPARIVVTLGLGVAIVMAFAEGAPEENLGLIQVGGLDLQPMPLIVAMILAGSAWDLWKQPTRFVEWVKGQSYAVTDRRVLVLQDGDVIETYSILDVGAAERRPKRRVKGFFDIVWGRRGHQGSRTRRGRDRRAEVMSFLGFKGLTENESQRAMDALAELRRASARD